MYITKKPSHLTLLVDQAIGDGQVCLVTEPQNCTTSGSDGKFDLPPRTHTKWMFIMVESFPDAAPGTFIANAPGFYPEQFDSDYLRPVTIRLSSTK